MECQTRVTVISHYKELGRNSNSARLIPLLLAGGSMLIRGRRGETLDPDQVKPGGFRHIVLYPAEDALSLETWADFNLPAEDHGVPINLIVPDGNWRQARRTVLREPSLRGLPIVSLPVGAPSQFRLRRQKDSRHLSTCEAVARALGLLDGLDVQQHLEEAFKMMVDRTLWSRGELPADAVTGGIPSVAYTPPLVFKKRE